MSKKTILMLGFHNHQPVGNFDDVFTVAYEQAYSVLLDHLDRHPSVKVALHYTGPLLEWLEVHRPDFIQRVRTVVERGQAEILSGGFYEPILSILHRPDAIKQILLMNEYIHATWSYNTQGFWLAERVWEPSIPTYAAEAGGLRYTILDQSHFQSSGIGPDDAHGYYITEDQGNTLTVFPIDYEMRYTIPWKPVKATITYLRKKHDARPGRGWIFADDGEKFGAWPETYENVIQKGWLDELFEQIEENSDWLETMTFSEYLNSHPPSGRAYFPTASYPEMMRWSLPHEIGEEVERFIEELGKRGEAEFVRPGFWRNFMAKYPEANNLHKRMMYASNRVAAADIDDETREKAWRHILRSQTNCPYWHGVFGGLYLNFLRHASYAEMLTGEAVVTQTATLKTEIIDFDADGQPEIIVENAHQVLFFSPHEGATLREWDWRHFPTNLINTMARRPEVYHKMIATAVVEGQASSKDVGGKTKAKSAGLADELAYDRYNRWCLIDLFPAAKTDLRSFARADFNDEGDFADSPYAMHSGNKDGICTLVFQREGTLQRRNESWPVSVEKTVQITEHAPGMIVSWNIRNRGSTQYVGTFGSEWNFGLLAGNADDRYVLINDMRDGKMLLGEQDTHEEVDTVSIIDHWQGVDIRLDFDQPATIWRYPVETISLSEGGYEKTYQGTAIFPHWKIALEPDAEWSVNVVVTVDQPIWHEPT